MRTCVYRVLGVTASRNCYIASMEFNNTVCCNLIGSDRFLLVHTKPWLVLPDVFFPPPHLAHAHSGKYVHGKIRLVYETTCTVAEKDTRILLLSCDFSRILCSRNEQFYISHFVNL